MSERERETERETTPDMHVLLCAEGTITNNIVAGFIVSYNCGSSNIRTEEGGGGRSAMYAC